MKNWGGDWTKQKLDAFEKYVRAYLKIMNKQKEKYNGWPTTIYFDGFAGSGINLPKEDNLKSDPLNGLELENEASQYYVGAAERVVSMDLSFDEYYFVDCNKKAIESLKKKLSPSQKGNRVYKYIVKDVNEGINKLSLYLDSKKSALVFLDPFGMDIQWNTISLLKGKRVDLWILIPTGVAINRLLDREGELRHLDKLEECLGLSETEIKREFYLEKEEFNLFNGKIKSLEKISDSISHITKLYIKQLKTIWNFVTDEPLVLINSKNVPIYHFVFASNNSTAFKIASGIIKG